MGSLQTVLPFKLAATDESLTAHSGLALIGEYLRAMGVRELIDHELPRPGSAAGYEPSAHVLPLILMLAGGGRTLEDLRVLRLTTSGAARGLPRPDSRTQCCFGASSAC